MADIPKKTAPWSKAEGTQSSRNPSNDMPFTEQALRTIHWLAWRYRYLACFIVIGFCSVAMEVLLVSKVFPTDWPKLTTSFAGFVVSMLFAFYMNAKFNFRVSQELFLRSFVLFFLVSLLSFSLNYSAMMYLISAGWSYYPLIRFTSAGFLFAIAYYLHCKFTFRQSTRNLGLAVYLLEDDRIDDAYDRVQGQFDHIHCDLVDASFSENAPAVAIEKLHKARALCTWHPLCLHLMSKTPLLWMEQCWDLVDWFVIHVDIEDDVMDVIARCREHGKKIGVTWHHSVSVAQLISYLPHVDFVMILGIDKPGHSNQEIMDSAIEAAFLFDELSSRYGYRVMFDGGVTTENAHHIPATHIVSSSTVLQAENPIQNALTLMWGDPRERK